jgi:hypothetical protein
LNGPKRQVKRGSKLTDGCTLVHLDGGGDSCDNVTGLPCLLGVVVVSGKTADVVDVVYVNM